MRTYQSSFYIKFHTKALPWLMQLLAGLSPRSYGSVHVGNVVDKMSLRENFLRVLLFLLLSVISLSVCTPVYHMEDEQQDC
jgi:hypothetical protein